MNCALDRNPLHLIIDLLYRYRNAMEMVHQANTVEQRRDTLSEWSNCHSAVWSNPSNRNDSIRAIADPAKAWLTNSASRHVDRQDFDIIEECVVILSSFAISSFPMSVPSIYSKAYTSEERLHHQWSEQGNRIIELSNYAAKLRDISARGGAVWYATDDKEKTNSIVRAEPLPISRPDVVLVTVNEHETRAVLSAFEGATGCEAVATPIEDRVYHDLGTVNGTRVFHAISEMGTSGVGAMQQTVERAIRLLDPGSVIAVGIAFGVDEGKQAIGDILLSKQLRLYEMQRLGTEETVHRGSLPDASPRLVSHFRGFIPTKWQGASAKFGVMLTGEKLVDALESRKLLLTAYPEAIGGEMEGAGLYVSGYDQKVDWIVIKAICDFADGKKAENKESRQQLAAGNAAKFVVESIQYSPLKRLR